METLKVRVENGKIIGKARESLEEGAELELCLAEPEEEMSPAELGRLRSALDSGWQSMMGGRYRPAEEILAERRAKR